MKRIMRLALAALACAFAGAGQAQDRYDNLDSAVNSIIQDIVGRGQLQGQSVFVGADDFFEKETGFDLRLRLSEMLHDKCRAALTDNGVRKLGMVESEADWVLHGRWWRETHDSGEYLHLRLFIARPVEGATPPQEHEGKVGLVPIDENVENAVKPTLRHWGDSVVRQLERDLPGTGSGKYRLHIRPFEVRGAVAQPEDLGRHLRNRWRRAFTGSRRFRLVGSTGFDGELLGEVFVADERVEVDLYVQDTQGGQVAAAFVTPGKGLFPSGLFGPDVTAELARCAGLVDAGRLGDARQCYEGVRAGAPGDAVAVEGVRAGLERVAGLEEEAVRGVRDAIVRGELEEARKGLGRLRGLNACHPQLGELEGEIARAERLQPGKRVRDCPECPELVVVPGGQLGRPFAVGVYEVTFGEWDACVSDRGCGGYRPSDEGWGRGRHPVINVSWDDAQAYVRWLSEKTGKAYRLLSEAEWEYVARAGTTTEYWWGDDIGHNRANCNSCGDSYSSTAPVGSFSANPFGLYDVHGNVWEWVDDCYGGDCGRRVVRGGSWVNGPRTLRSAFRPGITSGVRDGYVGFRVARTLMP